MKSDQPNKENLEQLLKAQEIRLQELQKMHQDAEKRARSFEADWSNLFDQNKLLREENQRIQQGYERLRIQKGGFGFKMLLASGMGGFFTALVLCFVYVKLKPKPDYVATFEQFRRENLFNYELKLSNGDFESVELSLEKCLHQPEFQAIKPEIMFSQKVVGAAKRFCKQ
jgi:hypothetical protein